MAKRYYKHKGRYFTAKQLKKKGLKVGKKKSYRKVKGRYK